jgi:hypothetical protein
MTVILTHMMFMKTIIQEWTEKMRLHQNSTNVDYNLGSLMEIQVFVRQDETKQTQEKGRNNLKQVLDE